MINTQTTLPWYMNVCMCDIVYTMTCMCRLHTCKYKWCALTRMRSFFTQLLSQRLLLLAFGLKKGLLMLIAAHME